MPRKKTNRMVSKIIMTSVLMTGLLFVGTKNAAAQEDCNPADPDNTTRYHTGAVIYEIRIPGSYEQYFNEYRSNR